MNVLPFARIGMDALHLAPPPGGKIRVVVVSVPDPSGIGIDEHVILLHLRNGNWRKATFWADQWGLRRTSKALARRAMEASARLTKRRIYVLPTEECSFNRESGVVMVGRPPSTRQDLSGFLSRFGADVEPYFAFRLTRSA